VIRNSTLRLPILLLLATSTIGGCSWFHHKTDYYNKAGEARPLDVPPDLDTPVTSNELIVPSPGASGTATAATSAGGAASAPSPGGTVAPAMPSGTVAMGEGLHVADSVEHTWQRVGLALERAQVGTISARDPGTHSYVVEVVGLTAAPSAAAPPPPEEHHWYSRILHPFGGGGSSNASASTAAPVSGHLTVRVGEDGSGGSRVNVEGNAADTAASDAAKRVLDLLRERLS
jgi:uncharacterized lipoprotein